MYTSTDQETQIVPYLSKKIHEQSTIFPYIKFYPNCSINELQKNDNHNEQQLN